MTQEEKQLLLKDLCARLPYGVKVTDGLHTITLKVRIDTAPAALAQFMQSENLRYYLRPLSSMTEGERKYIKERFCYEWEDGEVELMDYSIEIGDADCLIDWLLEHHFDFRGLIPKGLALKATKDMYKTE